MRNFEQLIQFYEKENEGGNIYLNDELIEFQEFYKIIKYLQLQTILEADSQTWYLINDDGTWNKASVKSEEELEQVELIIFK